ncbi:MAG: FosX/FosE/FosI family fosfomycin resistance thiol transferase [Sulfitobacter sp.]|nr:FosX/FosE/FosI family fosfomycin resistance thiol transferase [Sulfitobacter sp.]
MTDGLSHITFVVQNLDRMEEILVRVLKARKLYDSEEKTFSLSPERFYDVGGVWVAVMQGKSLPTRTYNHVAFRMGPEEYDARLAEIRALGLEVREGRARVEGEGHSIYFHDHDNHLFELHSGTLEERLESYAQGRESD